MNGDLTVVAFSDVHRVGNSDTALCCRGSNVATSQGFALSGFDCMARPMVSQIGSDAFKIMKSDTFKILGSDTFKIRGRMPSKWVMGALACGHQVVRQFALKRSTHTSMVRDRAVIRHYHSGTLIQSAITAIRAWRESLNTVWREIC